MKFSYIWDDHLHVIQEKTGSKIAIPLSLRLNAINGKDGTPATFHKQRSLSERLYREQGLDTQKLLGHKSQKMTDKYNDDRGKEWMVISV